MARLTGLVKRGGVYWLRVRVPIDLVAALKKREITYSLRTTERKQAELKATAERLRVQLEFESHRKGRSSPATLQTLRELSPDEIQGLVLRWFYDLERLAVQEDSSIKAERGSLEHREILATIREDMAAMQTELSGERAPSDPVLADRPLADLISANGLSGSANGASRERLRRLILRGLIEAQRRSHARWGGKSEDVGDADSYFAAIDPDAPPPQPKVVKQVTTLHQLLEQFLREKAPENLRAKTVLQYRAVTARFEEVVGAETPITEIGRHHCLAFRDLLGRMPSNASKRFRGMKMQRVANLVAERGGASLLTVRSINKSLETLSSLFSYAEDCGLVARNPAKKLRLAVEEGKEDRTFDADQLTALFAAPVFKNYTLKAGEKMKHSRYWVPLIALFCGMRQNEICQLYIQDIKERDGISYFALRRKLDDGTTATDKSLKTKNSWRDVPVHPTLK